MASIKLKGIPKGRIFICQKSGFIWVSNPKVASSTMRAWILKHELNAKDFSIKTSGSQSAISQVSARQFSQKQINQFFLLLPKICFIRNPYERFISAYMEKITRNQNKKLWHKKPKRQILEALGKDPVNINQAVSLDEFIFCFEKNSQ